jgi:hypothetical protein
MRRVLTKSGQLGETNLAVRSIATQPEATIPPPGLMLPRRKSVSAKSRFYDSKIPPIWPLVVNSKSCPMEGRPLWRP